MKFITEPKEPALLSYAPKVTFLIREFIIAPAHMGHGSRVTNNSHCQSRQPPRVRQALFIASISAWLSAFLLSSRRLRPSPTIIPFLTTTAPTGTSPSAALIAASSAARCIKPCISHLFYARDNGHNKIKCRKNEHG